mmetsp:Transcript_102319/g.153314  ORF Transcript_102319/g.153314 Transcript_102319/m.153314 type:complete len:83 (+) Transcript_102319:469-717(+)
MDMEWKSDPTAGCGIMGNGERECPFEREDRFPIIPFLCPSARLTVPRFAAGDRRYMLPPTTTDEYPPSYWENPGNKVTVSKR